MSVPAAPDPASRPPPAFGRGGSVLRRMGSLGGAAAVTWLILVGISRAQKTHIPPPQDPVQELRAIVVEPPPPPPPEKGALPPPPAGVPEIEPEIRPEKDGLEIAVAIRPREVPAPPVPEHAFELDFETYNPAAAPAPEDSPNYVFRPTQVDQRPTPLYRKSPYVPANLIAREKNPRVILLFVVNADGTPADFHILQTPSEEVGEIMVDAVNEWRFRPAMRNGRKVRCLVQLPIFIHPRSSSPFSLD